jgi:DNA-binding NarL/FixJ family response regulator
MSRDGQHRRITNNGQDQYILDKEKPDAKLAELFGLTEKQIVDRRYLLRTRTRSKYGKSLPVSILQGRDLEIKEMIDKGMWQPEMARQLNCTPGTLSGYIRRKCLREKPITRFDDKRVMHIGED